MRIWTIWLIMLLVTVFDIVCTVYDLSFRWPGRSWLDLVLFCIILTIWRCLRGAFEPVIQRLKTGSWPEDE